MKLNLEQINDVFGEFLQEDFSQFSHRILGTPNIGDIKKNIFNLISNPSNDLGFWKSGRAIFVGRAKKAILNNRNFYAEIFWLNFGTNPKDAYVVFREALRYARWREYDGLLYGRLRKDYEKNKNPNFDSSTYGILF